MPETLAVRADSRYKDTRVFQGNRGLEFGLWVAPTEFDGEADDDDTQHTVEQSEVGFLDKVAVNAYGAGYEGMGWILAQTNGIIDAEAEMYAGQVLRIPARSRLMAFSGRTGA
jgi:hypothetical protein